MEFRELQWNGPNFVIGLTGGIGSGKSVVGEMFQDLGARLLNADLVAREVLFSAELRPKLTSEFGEEILGSDGEISREALARIVFTDEAKRLRLNDLIHPGVRGRFHETIQSLTPGQIMVYDVPLLFEAGLEKDFDLVLVVSASRDVRLARVKERNGWSEEEFNGRDGAQIPLTEKEKRADLVINNSAGLDALRNTVGDIYAHVLKARNEDQEQQS